MATIRVDELILPVASVRLERGGLEISVRVHGPTPAASGHIRLFDDLGQPVTDPAVGSPSWLDIPQVEAHDVLSIDYHLQFEHIRQGAPVTYEVR